MSALVGATVVGTVAAVASIAAQAAALPRAETATSKPSTSCAKVQTTAAKVLAADDAFLNATTTNAEDAALDREDSAIDALATALRGCDAVAMGTACSGLVTTAGQIVASDKEFDRAEGDAAENAALAKRDPAIAELDVRLSDCRSGKVPEACAASVRAARDVVRAEAKYEHAKTEKTENVALTREDRAIATLKVRLLGCNAAPTAAACPAVLQVGRQVVDAEDRFHVATSDADTDAALDAESAAIEDLDAAIKTCTGTSTGGTGSTSGSGSSGSSGGVDLFGDTYVADLTKGHGDFVAKDVGAYATQYAPDGFLLVISDPGTWGPAGVQSGLSHVVLSATVDVDAGKAPGDSSFGPFCWHDPTHGYGFVVSGSGEAELVRVDGSYTSLPRLASTTIPAAGPRVTLTITCVRTEPFGSADVRVGGYVNVRKVLDATTTPVDDFQYTGFAGHTTTTAPAEWNITQFKRLGPEDLPDDAPR